MTEPSLSSILAQAFPGGRSRSEGDLNTPVEVSGTVKVEEGVYLNLKMSVPLKLNHTNFVEYDSRLIGSLKAHGADGALQDVKSPYAAVVLELIKRSCETVAYSHIQDAKTAKEAYEKLQEVYSQQAEGNQQHLMMQYKSFKKLPEESIEQMYGRFVGLVATLKLSGVAISEVDQGTTFLYALPEEYTTYRGSIVLNGQTKLSQIVPACQRASALMDMEKMSLESSSSKVYYTAGSSSGSGGFKGTCNYCKEPGHRIRECRKLAEKKAREQEESDDEKETKKKVHFTKSRVWYTNVY
jgi:hypothetical protein